MAAFSKIVWLAAVRRDNSFTFAERAVVEEIGDTANLAGFGAWRSNEQLMDAFKLSRTAVQNARRRAVKLGYLVPTSNADGGRGMTVHYRLALPGSVET